MNFKFFAAASIISASFTSPVFAHNDLHTASDKVADKVANRFNADFKGASGIWNITSNYDEILFIWHDQLMQSYYTKDGQLIGTYHHIDAAQLPAQARETIRTQYKGYELKNASIIERPNQAPGFFATLVGNGRVVKLDISSEGEVGEL